MLLTHRSAVSERATLVESPPESREFPSTALSVVVAEDDAAFRQYLAETLMAAGHQVAEARHGRELLELLYRAGEAFDVVVTDYNMPGMAGADLLASLRDAEAPWPTVLMSAFANEEVIRQASELGVVVVSKPFPISDLLRAVADVFRPGASPLTRDESFEPTS